MYEPACMYVYYVPIVSLEARRGPRPPETGFIGGCEPPYGCREPNTGPLERQQVLLPTESSVLRP